MNPQLRRRFASAALIVGFFVAWELLCLLFGVKEIVLPRPSQIVVTLGQRMPAIWPHAIQTLYTTLVGFALGIMAGVFLGALVGSSKVAYDVAYPLLVGFSSIPKVAVTQAFVGTVIAETVASNRGIGNLMMIASSSFDVPLVFAGLLVLAVLGVALYVIFSFIENRVTGWAHRKDEFAMG